MPSLSSLGASIDSLFRQLNKVTEIELIWNNNLKTEISNKISNKYLEKNRLLQMKESLSPEMISLIDDSGLPKELMILPLTLSNFDNQRVNEKGGTGIWQLKYHIAKKYGLRISTYIDERRDNIKATEAAIKYIKELFATYNDWNIVTVAFVADPIEISKTYRLAGGILNYNDIKSHLSYEYSNFVTKFHADLFLTHFAEQYGINLESNNQETIFLDEVPINKNISIHRLAKALGMDYDSLKGLNPVYKRHLIPGDSRTYMVKIPRRYSKRFYELGDSIYQFGLSPLVDASDTIPIAETYPIKPKSQKIEPVKIEKSEPVSSAKWVYYTVRSGDYLGHIADIFDVYVSQVKSWNGLKSDKIYAGQKLKISVPKNKYNYYKKITTYSASELKKIADKD